MKLIIEPHELIHIPEKSGYNCNYYRHKNGAIIYEYCDECYNVYEYYLVSEDFRTKTFIGSIEGDRDDSKGWKIDFMNILT